MRRSLFIAGILLFNTPVFAQQPNKDETTYKGRPLSTWVKDLRDPSPVVREEALEAIALLGPEAATVADVVRPFLRDPSVVLRLRAALALWKIERKADTILPILMVATADPETETRLLFLETLRQTALYTKALLGILIEYLADPNAAVRSRAESLLRRLPDRVAVPALIAVLDHKNATVVQRVLHLIESRGTRAGNAAPALRKSFKDTNPEIRLAAAKALLHVAPDDRSVVPVLIESSRSNDQRLRSPSLAMLSSIRPPPQAVVTIFEEALKDPDESVRVLAAVFLYENDRRTRELLPVLFEVLKNERPTDAHLQAVELLGRMTGEAKTIVPTLLESIRDPQRSPNALAEQVRVLTRMGEEGLKGLQKALDASSVRGKILLIAALAKAGSGGIEVLSREFPRLAGNERELVLMALARVEVSESVLPIVAECLKSHDPYRWTQAFRLVRLLGRHNPAAVPLLIETMKDAKQDMVVRVEAAALAGRPNAASKQVVPVLCEILLDPRQADRLRQEAAASLGRLGPTARATLPTLKEVLKTARGSFKTSILHSLREIDPADTTLLTTTITHFDTEMAGKIEDYTGLARLLQLHGPEAKAAMPSIIKALSRSGPYERIRPFVQVLKGMGTEAKEALPELYRVAIIDEPTSLIQFHEMVWSMGHKNEAVALSLAKYAERHNWLPEYRARTLTLLERMGPDALPALPALMKLWKAEPYDALHENIALAETLVRIDRKAARVTLPWLREHSWDEYADEAPRIIALVSRLDPQSVNGVEGLLALIRDEKIRERHPLVEALGDFGPEAKEAIPDLVKYLQGNPVPTDSSKRQQAYPLPLRLSAARSLLKIDPKLSDRVVAALIDILSEDSPRPLTRFRKQALPILAALGPSAKAALPALSAYYARVPDPEIRKEAIEAMRRIDPKALERLGR